MVIFSIAILYRKKYKIGNAANYFCRCPINWTNPLFKVRLKQVCYFYM
nr:MAG TPA: Suv3 C-terminal domain 1 [Caudoviricetes sp.]